MTFALFSAAFVQGFAGSWHCPGMCGPIAHVLASGGGRTWWVTLFYNFGRSVSYFSVGLLLGLTGGLLNTIFLSSFAAVVGGLLIIVFGTMYLFAGGPGALVRLPDFVVRGLGRLLRSESGAADRRRPLVALSFGMVSGLLPCGMLMPAYALALGSGDALAGAVAMVFFSLGTYPAMLATGAGSSFFWKQLNSPELRRVFGVAMIVLGIATIYMRVYVPHDHGAHGAHHESHGSHMQHGVADEHEQHDHHRHMDHGR
jgi:sulfite exporter TauE/SafE